MEWTTEQLTLPLWDERILNKQQTQPTEALPAPSKDILRLPEPAKAEPADQQKEEPIDTAPVGLPQEDLETYYLIDYENVTGKGLTGCDQLTKKDHILIFFTKNAFKIDMRLIANHGGAELQMIQVAAGDQSADMHIVSYLGYLIGQNQGKPCRFVVVSKDSDFDKVLHFWKENSIMTVSKALQINGQAPKKAPVNLSPVVNGKLNKTAINNQVMKLLSKAGEKAKIIDSVASIVTKNSDAPNKRQIIYRLILSQYGQQRGREIYGHIKDFLWSY